MRGADYGFKDRVQSGDLRLSAIPASGSQLMLYESVTVSLQAICSVLITLIKHEIVDNPIDGEIRPGEFQRNSILFRAKHPRVDFSIQGFTACPYLEIQNNRSLPWWQLTFL